MRFEVQYKTLCGCEKTVKDIPLDPIGWPYLFRKLEGTNETLKYVGQNPFGRPFKQINSYDYISKLDGETVRVYIYKEVLE